MTALHALGAAALNRAYRAGTLSPVEVARAVVAHAERHEPRLCALYAFDPEATLAMARASEDRWRAGTPWGPLDGVPVTVKENIATRGVPVPLGSAATELRPAPDDAPPAARLREAGAVFVAKTTMPDLGMLSSGLSSFHPLARNPWNAALNPGGSSAGAGAACAAGYGPLHLGTDIGGSIRLPAAWCGVVGFKPSGGRVPIQPPYIGRVAGPLARSVDDVARAMAVLSRPDWRDTMSLPAQELDWSAAFDTDAGESTGGGGDPARALRGLRIGLLLDAGWGMPLEPDVRAAVVAAARLFEAAGAVVEPLAAFTTPEMADGIDRFWRMRAWLDLQALPADRSARVLPYIRDWAAAAAGMSGAEVFRAFGCIGALRDAAVAACQPFDAVISPVAPVSGFAAEWAGPLNDPARAMAHIGFTLPANMSEQPALSLPLPHAGGRPQALQITGRRHDDLGVLRLGRALERLRPALPAWPLDGA